jgi:hypothetical protein
VKSLFELLYVCNFAIFEVPAVFAKLTYYAPYGSPHCSTFYLLPNLRIAFSNEKAGVQLKTGMVCTLSLARDLFKRLSSPIQPY